MKITVIGTGYVGMVSGTCLAEIGNYVLCMDVDPKRIAGDEPKLFDADTILAALDNADALIIVTEWKEFRSPDFDIIKRMLKSPEIFDGRNLYDPATVKKLGLEYHCIGRSASVNRIEK